MSNLPEGLVFHTAACRLAPLVEDRPDDIDFDPNIGLITADVLFTSNLAPGDVLRLPQIGDSPPIGLIPVSIPAVIREDGLLCMAASVDVGGGLIPVRLLGNSPALGLEAGKELEWSFAFSNIRIDGKPTRLTVAGGCYIAPNQDTTVYLTDYMRRTSGKVTSGVIRIAPTEVQQPDPLTIRFGFGGVLIPGEIDLSGISIAAVDSLYLPEAVALFNRMSVRPDVDRRAAINTLIRTLKDSGVWAKLAGLWVFAAHTQQAALLNWCRSTANFTTVNSPVFETDIGFSGNGVDAYLLLPQSSDNTIGVQGSDISLSLWVSRKQYVSTETAFASMSYGWNVIFVPANTGTTARWVLTRSSSNGGWMTTTTSRTGLFTLSRPSGGAAAYLYRDGSLIGTDSRANDSGTYGPTEISIFKAASYAANNPANYGTGTVSVCALGVGLTASQVALMYNAVNDYMAAVDLANKLGL